MSFWKKCAQKLRDAAAKRGYVCDACGAEIFYYPQERLCGACQDKLLYNDGFTCEKCGRKTVTEGVCLSCKRTLPNFTIGISPLVYIAETAALINRIKNGDRRLVYFLGESAADTLVRRLQGSRYELNEHALLIPVPLTQEKERARGYNQAEELARIIAAKLGLALDTETLIKKRETMQQKHLTEQERAQNLKGAFHVHKRKLVQDKTIILVDDVMTTGATGSECARTLMNAGAKAVVFLTVASLPEKVK